MEKINEIAPTEIGRMFIKAGAIFAMKNVVMKSQVAHWVIKYYVLDTTPQYIVMSHLIETHVQHFTISHANKKKIIIMIGDFIITRPEIYLCR